jgi:D-xylulose reductase
VVVLDLKQPKLNMAGDFGAVTPVNIREEDPGEAVRELTDGWGADLVFEASGSAKAAAGLFDLLCPGGRVIYIGMPADGVVPLDIVAAQAKEARIETIFRYANMYPRALNLLGSGKIDLKPMISETFPFGEAVRAFDYAVDPKPTSVKIQIEMPRD